jgi:hypothetical protein
MSLKRKNGSGYYEHSSGCWWAVVRHPTHNLLLDVYPTEKEAQEAYETAQREIDEARAKEKHEWERIRKIRLGEDLK